MIALFDLIPKWVWAALVAALTATSCKLTIDNAGFRLEIEKGKTEIAQVRGEHLAAVTKATEQAAAIQAAARKTEQDLQTAMNEHRRKTNENLATLTSERDSLRVRLQTELAAHPPFTYEAPAAPGAGEATTGDHGAILPDPFGSLVEEAYRADQIRLELRGCYRAYDDARAALAKPIEQSSQP
jgi:hypothetical protein